MAKKVTWKQNISKKVTLPIQIKPKTENEIRKEKIKVIKDKSKENPFKIKYNKAGQPTLFQEKYAKEMLEYFQKHIDWWYFEDYIEETLNAFGQPVDQIKQRAKAIPMFEKYALIIGLSYDTLLNRAVAKDWEWKLLHREFFLSYKQCLWIQRTMLKELGLTNSYNTWIVKLLLSAEHGIYDIKEDNDWTEKWKKIADVNNTNIDETLNDFITK